MYYQTEAIPNKMLLRLPLYNKILDVTSHLLGSSSLLPIAHRQIKSPLLLVHASQETNNGLIVWDRRGQGSTATVRYDTRARHGKHQVQQ